ncbi:ester cyclase [Mucilaginibacter rubeus]|uniref:Ester cyclase n=1 Tax=Mucilaginibacter rubeus TaxID=2027860 RepID=A0A5C1HSJ9_9SPHI|nr:ester cyclase [Mucilaginibacter rubeus]QEM08535.1 ester cyclase [Mucilaginibacter rubeus]
MNNTNKDFIIRWFTEVWNNSNPAVMDEMLHPDVKVHGVGETFTGSHLFKDFYDDFRKVYSNLKFDIEKMISEGDEIAALVNVFGIHTATGKEVHFSGVTIAKIEDGVLTSGWNYFDFLGLSKQVGNLEPEQLRK